MVVYESMGLTEASLMDLTLVQSVKPIGFGFRSETRHPRGEAAEPRPRRVKDDGGRNRDDFLCSCEFGRIREQLCFAFSFLNKNILNKNKNMFLLDQGVKQT